MKIIAAFTLIAVAIYGFFGLAEAGIFSDIITHFKKSNIMDKGQIPLPALMFLLAIGIIGFLGIRRKG
jgi:hypothetical protein